MKDYTNHPNTTADRCPLNYPANIKQNLKTEIYLRLCFAPLLVVWALGVLGWSILLPIEQSVMN
jgi:hypothetical protein